ncbi:MAG: 30S ribosomal protein S12 methylthiotransferase RimO [Sphingobacteriaceae bacterium]|nr:30S ribosomal protein S12 methylthiotransferase RimO [Sphingobacteriaceae bacterium]
MKTKNTARPKVNIITLGCSKNLVDSENLITQLKANQFDVTHESAKDDAQVVIVNTCGFIENAKQESIDTIFRYIDAKQAGLVDKLYVTGCLSHRYKDELEAEMPEVDAFFGTMELPRMLKTLNADYKHELLGERIITTPSHTAFMKIAEGCNRPCSFCAIPLMRGKHVSKSLEDLEREASNLVKSGVKELVLIAQDLTYYGLDLYGKRNLADLLKRLSDINDLEWIRLQYAYPSQFPEDILPVMRERNNICNYLDIPLQHASDNMLKSMRRGISAARTQDLIDKIRFEVPNIHLRTTMISGYPGESEADQQAMLDFVAHNRFERLGVFAYSHEENTAAFNLVDDVPQELKEARVEEIMALQQDISHELNQAKVGQELKVLFDRKEGQYFVGRTEFDSPEVDNEVLVDASKHFVRIGDFATVHIDSAEEFDLYATPII